MPLTIDPFTTALLAGDDGRATVWGLNLNLASPPPRALLAAFEPWAAAARAALRGAGAYVYPGFSLHITCASPAPFTNCEVAPGERAALCAAWAAALREEVAAERRKPGGGEWPAAPFPLVYERVTLESAAAIIRIADPTGAVGRVRALIDRASRHPAVAGLPGGLAERSRHRIPGIIHTTVVRFGAPPDAGVDEAAIRAAFAPLAEGWAPVTVVCDALTLVEEAATYMHLHLDGADAGRVVLALPFGEGGAGEPPAAAPAGGAAAAPQ